MLCADKKLKSSTKNICLLLIKIMNKPSQATSNVWLQSQKAADRLKVKKKVSFTPMKY